MIATDTTNEFGTTVAKHLRTVMQGKVANDLHEVKERALVDKPITEAEVVALLEASYQQNLKANQQIGKVVLTVGA